MGRHERRQNSALFCRNAVGGLETFLCAPDDVRLRGAPRLQHTVAQYLDMLSARARFCMVCSSLLHDRHEVGMVLIALPISSRPSSASCCGVCRAAPMQIYRLKHLRMRRRWHCARQSRMDCWSRWEHDDETLSGISVRGWSGSQDTEHVAAAR